MSAYMIISVTPEDEEGFAEYERRTLAVVERFGGRPVARDTASFALEGAVAPGIAVILEFPSKEHVRAFYESEEYAPLKAFRHAIARAGALVMDVA
ncbi:DUF1330 domain-containing protein [Pseudonocardia kunmingensis]|uniref:Uncharacterized protein (DUF1330 family) n=1 Tax=Pseudonocardia kunmingensis TaxID=630975 RepID=A0A543DZA8_9PSEU|nr:DUF1330 domain-containing protein [Pseudonocardia kunmingensis]TQM14656.1 uncharacterized protein (DUF1330 family) [Pseudonocardia kunmingensis]